MSVKPPSLIKLQGLSWYAASLMFVGLCCVFFPPFWRTNDDVAMAMFSSGYGLAIEPSAQLFFSNVVWGKLVHLVPAIGDINPYSLATLLVLSLTAGIISHAISRAQKSILIPVGVIGLVYLYPILSPQFTVNAGVLMVATMVCYLRYERDERLVYLACAVALAFLSFLVRSYEAALIIVIALPLIRWSAVIRDCHIQLATVILLGSLVLAFVADKNAYDSPEWQAYNDLNAVRAAYTDFEIGKLIIKNHHSLMTDQALSQNDIGLFSRWFFEDPAIANPEKLGTLIDAARLDPFKGSRWTDRGLAGVKTLTHKSLVLLLILAALLLVLCFSARLALAWLVLLLVSFAVGIVGRPGVPRVYEAALILLIVYPLVSNKIAGIKKIILLFVLPGLLYHNTVGAIASNKTENKASQAVRRSLLEFPQQPFVVWGGGFPYKYAYPVLGRQSDHAYQLRLYGLGVTALAPGLYASAERQAGRGLIDLLQTDNGVYVIIRDRILPLLEGYCTERLNSQLEIIGEYDYAGSGSLRRMRCVK